MQPVLNEDNKLTAAEEEVLKGYIFVRESILESKCYSPLQDAFSCMANTQCYITAGKHYLNGEAPDISICLASSSVMPKLLCYSVIKVKRPSEPIDISRCLGQVNDYILSLMQAQSDRC